MIRVLTVVFLLAATQVWAGPRLYVFDCGQVTMNSMAMFGLEEGDTEVRELFVPCYLVEHEQGRLFWDGGLPQSVAAAGAVVEIEGGSMSYSRWIIDQLKDMGLQPADIDHAAYSHLHFDHVGAASALVDNNVFMQRSEWDAAMSEDAEYLDASLLEGLKGASLTFIEGDHDVFGDGSVRFIYAPGHTAGHQLLLLDLENTGPVLLSGDLYHTRANRKLSKVPTFNADAGQTLHSMQRVEEVLAQTGATLWIEHDKELADSLKKAPAYYD